MSMNIQDTACYALDLRAETVKLLVRRDSLLIERCKGIKEERLGHIAQVLSESRILIWEKTPYSLAKNQCEAFIGATVTPEMAEECHPEMWLLHDFTMVFPVEILQGWNIPPTSRCGAVLSYINTYELASIWFMQDDEDHMYLCGNSSDIRLGVNNIVVALLFAGREFTRQRIASKEPVLLPRAARRRAARDSEELPDIRMIQLREREASIWHSAIDRQYHHSWIVRGHWRRLHEPRKKDGAVATWIESYVKGQGPLLQPREPIFAVTR